MQNRETIDGEKIIDRVIYNRIWQENEISSNILCAKVFITIAAGAVFCILFGYIGVIERDPLEGLKTFLPVALLNFSTALICLKLKGRGWFLKHILILSSVISSYLITNYARSGLWLYLSLPILISSRYCNKDYTYKVSCVIFVLLVFSCFNPGFPVPVSITNTNQWKAVISSASVLDHVQTPAYRNSLIFERFVTLLSATPGICMIAYMSALMADHGWKMVIRMANDSQKQQQLTNKMVLSQVQPHFLYNTLTAIMAIEGNPDETVDAIAEFGQYLRENLNSLQDIELVPFDNEIEHIRRYIGLEKLRFGDKLNVIYDLGYVDFLVPPLTVQMLVENSVKHGMSHGKNAGTITIESCECENEYRVTVTDNGIGFDTESIKHMDSTHIGLRSVESRLRSLLNASIDIKSSPGEGTCVTMHIPKKNEALLDGDEFF